MNLYKSSAESLSLLRAVPRRNTRGLCSQGNSQQARFDNDHMKTLDLRVYLNLTSEFKNIFFAFITVAHKCKTQNKKTKAHFTILKHIYQFSRHIFTFNKTHFKKSTHIWTSQSTFEHRKAHLTNRKAHLTDRKTHLTSQNTFDIAKHIWHG